MSGSITLKTIDGLLVVRALEDLRRQPTEFDLQAGRYVILDPSLWTYMNPGVPRLGTIVRRSEARQREAARIALLEARYRLLCDAKEPKLVFIPIPFGPQDTQWLEISQLLQDLQEEAYRKFCLPKEMLRPPESNYQGKETP